ncbi:hypothetical protein AB1Y20_000206 [Prymnesium parvum]
MASVVNVQANLANVVLSFLGITPLAEKKIAEKLGSNICRSLDRYLAQERKIKRSGNARKENIEARLVELNSQMYTVTSDGSFAAINANRLRELPRPSKANEGRAVNVPSTEPRFRDSEVGQEADNREKKMAAKAILQVAAYALKEHQDSEAKAESARQDAMREREARESAQREAERERAARELTQMQNERVERELFVKRRRLDSEISHTAASHDCENKKLRGQVLSLGSKVACSMAETAKAVRDYAKLKEAMERTIIKRLRLLEPQLKEELNKASTRHAFNGWRRRRLRLMRRRGQRCRKQH